jgi:5-methylcytosine-specific restriction endonuclease McrA
MIMRGVSARNAGRRGGRWDKTVAAVKATMPAVCWICAKDIDLSLHHHGPMSYTVDHVVPLSAGGDPYDLSNLRPAHKRCNSRKGKGAAPVPVVSSRRW